MHTNNTLVPEQFGFRQGKSTDNAAFKLTNSTIPKVNTRNRDHLYRLTANLSCFPKSAHHAGIKIFNSLPSNLRSHMNEKAQFEVALDRYLNTHCFYSVEEFLTFKNDS